MSSPRARISMRPELARSGWLDTMMGKSLRKIRRDRQAEQCKEVCLWLVLSRGVPPAGAFSRAPDTQGSLRSHLRHASIGLVLKTFQKTGSPFVHRQNVMCRC
jgi:hypothetical protein